MFRSDSPPRKNKDAQPPWKLEPFWPCRTWVEQQRLAEPFGFRLVRVAKDTDVRSFAVQKDSSVLRELPAFAQNMTDGDAEAS